MASADSSVLTPLTISTGKNGSVSANQTTNVLTDNSLNVGSGASNIINATGGSTVITQDASLLAQINADQTAQQQLAETYANQQAQEQAALTNSLNNAIATQAQTATTAPTGGLTSSAAAWVAANPLLAGLGLALAVGTAFLLSRRRKK